MAGQPSTVNPLTNGFHKPLVRPEFFWGGTRVPKGVRLRPAMKKSHQSLPEATEAPRFVDRSQLLLEGRTFRVSWRFPWSLRVRCWVFEGRNFAIVFGIYLELQNQPVF